jgi:hypothetical protein
MRNGHLAAAALALAALATPLDARAWFFVRARPVYVVPAPVYVAPAPVYVAPAPVYVNPQEIPNVLTTKLPIGTSMWTLPNGCNAMTVNDQAYYQCGVNWMKMFFGSEGAYYGVVPPP